MSFSDDAGADGAAADGNSVPPASDATVNDAVADTTAPPQPDVDPDGGSFDAATRDANTVIDRDAGPDGGSCGVLDGSFCDCDQDDSLKEAGAACLAPLGAAADCDDFDPLVHPGADFVAATWDPSSPHLPANDWDCDGVVTKQFNYNITCSLLDCTQGFSTDVDCGATGTYNYCKSVLNVLLGITICEVDHTEQLTQGCR